MFVEEMLVVKTQEEDRELVKNQEGGLEEVAEGEEEEEGAHKFPKLPMNPMMKLKFRLRT
jgi:hypothetical protein